MFRGSAKISRSNIIFKHRITALVNQIVSGVLRSIFIIAKQFKKEKRESFLGWTDEMAQELLPLSGYKYEALIYVSVKKIISEFELNLLGQLEKIRFSGVLVTRYENDLQKVTIEIDTDGDWKYQIFEGDKLNDIGKIIFGEMGKEKNPYITISLRGGKELNNKICDMLNRQKLYSGQPLYIGFNLDTKAINQQLIAKDLLGFNEEFVEHLKILSMSIGQINDLQAFK